jgi:hypothetical protein
MAQQSHSLQPVTVMAALAGKLRRVDHEVCRRSDGDRSLAPGQATLIHRLCGGGSRPAPRALSAGGSFCPCALPPVPAAVP